jgi:hypothetical protein
MKRYISLASALMVGSVIGQEKKPTFAAPTVAANTLAAVDAKIAAAVKIAAPVVAAQKARAVYISENTTEHDVVDSVETSVEPGVQVVNDNATSVTSQDAGTSAQSKSVNVRVNSATTANDPETSEGTSANEVQSHDAITTQNDAHTSEGTSNVDGLPTHDSQSYKSDRRNN